jgi:hypothetical protein
MASCLPRWSTLAAQASNNQGSGMEYKLKSETDAIADAYPSVLVSTSEEKLHYLLDALESMDKRTAQDLERLDSSGAEKDLKEFIRQDILARHQARRLPLQESAEELDVLFHSSGTEGQN